MMENENTQEKFFRGTLIDEIQADYNNKLKKMDIDEWEYVIKAFIHHNSEQAKELFSKYYNEKLEKDNNQIPLFENIS